MLEEDFQSRVIDLALRAGWMVTHFRPAQTRSGRWATPLEGHKGFPDLVLARRHVVLFRELKRDHENPSPEQQLWLEALGPVAAVWRPRDWETDVIPTLTAATSRRTA